ncbi:hypothetical protein M3_0016 [Lysinibacillus phage vB_LfM_LysYB1]|nr:hypothetical protein M3_0016 [Lysinibacillus phage vB_LfM_LysYB1]WAB25241.1 hypothetical protein M5_0063 [Lysinibacillus phage vB_LfM_LysYB2]
MLKFLSPVFKRFNTIGMSEEGRAVMEAIERELQTLSLASSMVRLESVITTATGFWLDHWGSWFGIKRRFLEPDESMRERILNVVRALKVTIPAIEQAVKDFHQDANAFVQIREPHVDVFKYGESVYSGRHKYQNYDYYNTAVIDIIMDRSSVNSLTNISILGSKTKVTDYFKDINELDALQETAGSEISIKSTYDALGALSKGTDESKPSLRDIVNEIKAAGVKVYFTHKIFIDTGNGTVDMTSKVPPMLSSHRHTSLKIFDGYDGLVYSENGFGQPWSGHRTLITNNVRYTSIVVPKPVEKVGLIFSATNYGNTWSESQRSFFVRKHTSLSAQSLESKVAAVSSKRTTDLGVLVDEKVHLTNHERHTSLYVAANTLSAHSFVKLEEIQHKTIAELEYGTFEYVSDFDVKKELTGG